MLIGVVDAQAESFVAFNVLGGLTWDAHLPRVASPETPPPPDAVIAGGLVVVCWQGTVRAFHAGRLAWATP